ncbi:hypothetical protein DB30_00832 [Enhygromyxa salina]|uniref:Uncharacterized protein n=1 Tax=Enhygromyxa salina TaxID=215803 RepID=A0A0C1ZPM8_9BACT|nr:hypothetical protein [Enhygromyxa salina]KIG12998.1 hypothetical protein DB30_00832 [Enhygromyxa salina]
MERKIEFIILGASILCAACSDETTGPDAAAFEELCGVEEPVRVLPLELDHANVSFQTSVVGGRYLVQLRTQPSAHNYATQVWSVGRCGEDPVKLYDGPDATVWVYEQQPAVPYIVVNDHIVAHDLAGVAPPNPVFQTSGLWASPSDHGLVSILGDGDVGTLALQRWPNDPLTQVAELVVLVDEVKTHVSPNASPPPNVFEVFHANNDEVFALTVADELVVVDLATLAVTTLAQDVREFDVGPSGRWLLWQSTEITNDDPDWHEGPVFMLDRESGESILLDETALRYQVQSALTLEPLDVFCYQRSLASGYGRRCVQLSTLESYDALGAFNNPLAFMTVANDTDAVIKFGTTLTVVNSSTGEATVLHEGAKADLRIDAEHVNILRKDTGELIQTTYSGQTRVLAEYATREYQIGSDGRVVTPVAVNNDDIGQLVIIDPDTLDASYIAERVHERSLALHEDDDGGLITSYAIVDSDPERAGVWVAKPAK